MKFTRSAYSAFLLILVCHGMQVIAAPQHTSFLVQENKRDGVTGDAPSSSVIPMFNARGLSLLPLGTEELPLEQKSSPSSTNRTGRFFGLTTGASTGNNLQLGLSFIVPFLNIPFPFGGGSYYGLTGTNNYGTSPSYGTTASSSLSLNTGSIIFAVVIGLAAIVLIPLFIYYITGVNTSPFGRSDDVQGILTNLISKVDDALLQHNVDGTSCLQRAICTYVGSSRQRVADGNAGSTEKIIEGLASSSYLNSLLEGTRIQQSIRAAKKSGAPCNAYVNKCPFDADALYQTLLGFAHHQHAQLQHGDENEHFNNEVPTTSD